MMTWRDPARLSEGQSPTAVLLDGYAARTGGHRSDEGAAWQRLQAPLDAHLRPGRAWAQTRLLAGAFTVAFGLFVLARSATLSLGRESAGASAERRAGAAEKAPGGGGASGSLDGDSRGAGGMEGASGGVGRACDGV